MLQSMMSMWVLFNRYGMRFISKVLKDTLQEKFPDATEDELLKVFYFILLIGVFQ